MNVRMLALGATLLLAAEAVAQEQTLVIAPQVEAPMLAQEDASAAAFTLPPEMLENAPLAAPPQHEAENENSNSLPAMLQRHEDPNEIVVVAPREIPAIQPTQPSVQSEVAREIRYERAELPVHVSKDGLFSIGARLNAHRLFSMSWKCYC